ncbi:hypothetical protein AQJ43_23770 [Streptomyces avermitilis]|uniref:Uncharacterized protein n=2 Tax=Streptomyces avermitilis TaxID=33903 RepID=Q82C44_STRAW|nr:MULTISPECIES: hypothetical protein [Streptomyces]KUN52246.1 hypothetical protein AQJ43_23770 [Streptomyces avermitilis]MYT01091.1 hypothetical protein [Streptomyces sp. SID5469]OOV30706.1 hypothetical protein SM007_16000 [Streptomyces avermitilis]BAC73222.1 hypothetical protein SAVERM_5510 [Streptomyces avermitilis MA-4680 = NBRC 14893]BBJ53665.1 hypothetical protein SAVMC3_62940 [Streptomyces avermitilis]
MTQPNRKRIKLETLRAQRLEATGTKELEVIVEDEKFVFPLFNWLPIATYKKIQSLPDKNDLIAQTEILLGKEKTERLFELGLTTGDLLDIFDALQADAGVSTGESTSSSD